MNKKCVFALLICFVLILSACGKRSGAATGGAPRTPFIGGTSGITITFLKDNPPPEVTDEESFAFQGIVRLKNDGEFKVPKNDIKVNLVGFDPSDFGQTFDDLKDVEPTDDLDSKKRDAEGNIIDGTESYASFPKSGSDFIPTKFIGNIPFTFRADVCYNYETQSLSKLCILRDMINVRDDSICRPTGVGTTGRQVYSSSAPVQITNFRQSVVGKDKISFSFDVILSSKVDVFWSKDERKPVTFDDGCPRDPRARRQVENQVGVEVTEIPTDPIFTNVKCGGLDGRTTGVIRLVNGQRTVVCTADLVQDRLDLEKGVGVKLKYNVLDTKETQVLIKHLAAENP